MKAEGRERPTGFTGYAVHSRVRPPLRCSPAGAERPGTRLKQSAARPLRRADRGGAQGAGRRLMRSGGTDERGRTGDGVEQARSCVADVALVDRRAVFGLARRRADAAAETIR